MKLLFLPVSILGGMTAGMIAKKLFALMWGLVDEHEPPDPKQRVVDHRKLATALVLEGAVFQFVRGAFDHLTRHGFARLTGAWPGEEAPERK